MRIGKVLERAKKHIVKTIIDRAITIPEFKRYILDSVAPPPEPVTLGFIREVERWINRYSTIFDSLQTFIPSDFIEEKTIGMYEIPIGLFDQVTSSKFHEASSMFELGEYYDDIKRWSTDEIWEAYKNEKLNSYDDKFYVIEASYTLFERGTLGGRLTYHNSGGSHKFAALWRRHHFTGQIKKVPAKVTVVKMKQDLKEWIENGGLVVIGDRLDPFFKENMPANTYVALPLFIGENSFFLIKGTYEALCIVNRAFMENRCVIINDSLLTAYTIQESNIRTLHKVFSKLKQIDAPPDKVEVGG